MHSAAFAFDFVPLHWDMEHWESWERESDSMHWRAINGVG